MSPATPMTVALPVVVLGVAATGLAVGSFLNVVVHRVPVGASVSYPPSSCPACGHRIRHRHNVPVLGWLLLRGRCADCSGPISVRYPAVELLTAALFVALTLRAAQLGMPAAAPALMFFAAVGVALGVIDLESRRSPDEILRPAHLVLALLLAVAATVGDDPAALVRAAVGAVASHGVHRALSLAVTGGRGLGDVRLAGLAGAVLAYLSYPALVAGVLAAAVLGGVVAAAALLRRSGAPAGLPWGPVVVAGALVGILASGPVLAACSSLVGLA